MNRTNAQFFFWSWALLCVGLAGAGPGDALDTVTLQQAGSTGRITIRGSIREYTGKSLEIFLGSANNLQAYPASEVIAVETPQTEAHRRGVAELQEGKVDAAKVSLQQALEEEHRPWVRRDILALLVRAALRRGDYATAGTRFLLLLQSDADTRHFELIPLAWESAKLDPPLAAQARVWMAEPAEAARLIGASHLLEDEMDGLSAERALDLLASSTDLRVRSLARAQLWRKSLKAQALPRDVIERWESRIDEMPERLRGGPWYVVGQGYLVRREHHRAAAALLWLPMVFDHDLLLTSRACVLAADSLATIGRKNEAAALYAETLDRFRGTPAATDAARALNSLSPPPATE